MASGFSRKKLPAVESTQIKTFCEIIPMLINNQLEHRLMYARSSLWDYALSPDMVIDIDIADWA
jgi:hypothetical protein